MFLQKIQCIHYSTPKKEICWMGWKNRKNRDHAFSYPQYTINFFILDAGKLRKLDKNSIIFTIKWKRNKLVTSSVSEQQQPKYSSAKTWNGFSPCLFLIQRVYICISLGKNKLSSRFPPLLLECIIILIITVQREENNMQQN